MRFSRCVFLAGIGLAVLAASDGKASYPEFSPASTGALEADNVVAPRARRDRASSGKVASSVRGAIARRSRSAPEQGSQARALEGRIPRELWSDDRILVVATLDDSQPAELETQVEGLGGEVRTGPQFGRMEVWIPPERLDALGDLPSVQHVGLPSRLVHTIGSVTASEVADSGAGVWHAAGYSGAGVRIGVVDTFLDWNVSQSTGDWPSGAQLETHNIDGGVFGESSTFGTALVEIIYDLAPGATYVAYEIATEADAIAALGQSATDDIDILVFPFSLFGGVNGMGDGSPCPPHAPSPCGSVAEAVQNARAAGVFVITGAGNHGASHWAGFYNPFPPQPFFHQFSDGSTVIQTTVCLPTGTSLTARMTWADAAVTSDYDLYVYRLEDTGAGSNMLAFVDASQDEQSGQPGQVPFEEVTITASGQTFGCSLGSTAYAYAIARFSAPTNRLISLYSDLSVPLNPAVRTPERSILPPGDLAEVYTVTGINGSTLVQLPNMSRGPLFGPGTTLDPPVVDKPDATGVDTAATTVSGFETLGGTSVSESVVAGQAALVMQSDPSLTADGLRTALNQLAAANPLPGLPTEVGAGLVRVGTNPPPLDSDGDGILDDGDGSGIAGDAPCSDGGTVGCDDNCPQVANAALPFPQSLFLGFGEQADQDGDGAGDLCDSCVLRANGPTIPDAGGFSQRNTDADVYGNVCDGDLDANGVVDAADEDEIELLIQFSIYDEDADLNGDGVVDQTDLDMLMPLGRAPGPSAADVQCNNGVDDDGDTEVDYPDDTFCASDPTLDDEGPNPEVNVVDSGLREAINTALGKPAGAVITQAEMLSLVVLDASGRMTTDLSGLEVAQNLETLDLRDNALTNLSVLSSLPSLATVYLYGNLAIGQPCDLNDDAEVGVQDALLALSVVNAESVPSPEDLAVADVAPPSGPGDGVVGVGDALLIFRSASRGSVPVCEAAP